MYTWTDKLLDYAMAAGAVVYATAALFYIGSLLSRQYFLTLLP